MSDVIERPSFFEGQILAAADLQASVDHASGQLARHERYLHLWGIASGLKLEKQDRSTSAAPPQAYVEVTLKAGMAVDGTGREIVVPEDQPLAESDFVDQNVAGSANPGDWFPLFLIGGDEAGASSTFGVGACAGGAPTRTSEKFRLQFGHPGEAAQIDNQDEKLPADGPGTYEWRTLVGYVQWDKTIGKFKDITDSDQGVGLRYAGVQADEVVARGGALVLRSASRNEAGKTAAIMDDSNGGELRFGLQNASGVVTPIFTVNAKGDVWAKGKIQGAVTPGSVQVQSGTALDGILMPLPPGVTADMVAPGKGTMHVHLMPRVDASPGPPTGMTKPVGFPYQCYVDNFRRLHCTIRWFDLAALGSSPQDLPGMCDYLMVVAVAAA
jgi:hypothetical protein